MTFINITLANKAFSHSLTSEDITKPMLAIDPTPATDSFIYTLNTSSSWYVSDVFLSIVVDTEVNKKSIAGYSQFRALQQLNPAVELDISIKEQVTV
jgi:hypothetical protein